MIMLNIFIFNGRKVKLRSGTSFGNKEVEMDFILQDKCEKDFKNFRLLLIPSFTNPCQS